jgi:hypothetical protein
MMARKELLAQLLRQGYEAELAFVAGLTDEEKAQVGKVDDWAAKDTIAHAARWKAFRVADIQGVVEGGDSTNIEDFDHENALIFEKYRDKSWNELLSFAEEAYQALFGQLQAMSETQLEMDWQEGRPIWRFVVGVGYIHPLLHLAGYYQAQGGNQRADELTALLGEPLLALDDSPAWHGTIHYNTACGYSLLGKKAQALAELGQALALTPNLIEWSQQDPDLDPIRGEAGYQALYED